jgi:ribosomal protein S18 acetylase RimI-like enzyme
MSIRIATLDDIHGIRSVAERTWPIAYGDIITPEQIDYMLNWMYSLEKLKQSVLASDELFLVAEINNEIIGFAGIQFGSPESDYTRLHKLYVLPNYQGSGIGKDLLNEVEKQAISRQTQAIHLNVNKRNIATEFYKKNGFKTLEEIVLDIGNGFVMDDYILIKNLSQ